MKHPHVLKTHSDVRDRVRPKHLLLLAVVVGVAVLAAGCSVSVPRNVQPVTNFDVGRYAGTWYELARIDHRFEKGLVSTSAQYTLNPDGTVKVVNRGFNLEKHAWKEAVGTARFLGDPRTAALKVSFFGPFYGGYNVVHLSDDYKTALVIGQDLDYFWLLSRERSLPEVQVNALLAEAGKLGVDLNKVIKIPQQ
ncbi:lipocalin family protein [Hydrogenophaga sp.]|uniref:lipocalin family protein n=1 Tax=Hydrogenophaga sp. TaxID=1904254 RepID=UPI00271C6DCE|nr:lipocalin family protein [Hydrogenophaga sp.]MDO9436336.1 lipocalin family protein [Hydrogenophaga sp.]